MSRLHIKAMYSGEGGEGWPPFMVWCWGWIFELMSKELSEKLSYFTPVQMDLPASGLP